MPEAMKGKSPLQVVGWLGRTGYQTIIHIDTQKQFQKIAQKAEEVTPKAHPPKQK
jgi:hypothetical protein